MHMAFLESLGYTARLSHSSPLSTEIVCEWEFPAQKPGRTPTLCGTTVI